MVDSIVRQSRHQFGADKDVFGPRFTKNITGTFENLCLCPVEDRVRTVRVTENFTVMNISWNKVDCSVVVTNSTELGLKDFARLLLFPLLHSLLSYFPLQSKIVRVLNLWQKNGVFKIEVIQPLLDMAAGSSSGAAPYTGTDEPGNLCERVVAFTIHNNILLLSGDIYNFTNFIYIAQLDIDMLMYH